ncbi:MAG TPA: hypothetical protein VKY86_12725 [Promicromonospora sp.]|nr:hypothetical protein [Promicromonospora sp.]
MVEVAAPPLGHGVRVAPVGGRGPAAHHLLHLPHRAPHRERGDRARRPERGQGERRAGMVAHLPLDGLAPAQEAGHLGQPHPRDGHRDHGFLRAPGPGPGGQTGQRGQRRPTAQVLQADVPAGGQVPAERVLGEEAVHGLLVAPLGEHRDPPQLQAVGRHRGRAQAHEREALGVVEAGRRARRRRAQQRPGRHGRRQLGQVERVHHRARSWVTGTHSRRIFR